MASTRRTPTKPKSESPADAPAIDAMESAPDFTEPLPGMSYSGGVEKIHNPAREAALAAHEESEARKNDPAQTLALTGSMTFFFKTGELTIQEPGVSHMMQARMDAARWATQNPEYNQVDPTLRNWLFICKLACACATKWLPAAGNGVAEKTISLADFYALTGREFTQIGRVLDGYVIGADEEDEGK